MPFEWATTRPEQFTKRFTFSERTSTRPKRRCLAAVTQQLEQSERRLQLALEAGAVGAWDWPDLSSRVNWWDERVFRMLGYDPREIEVTFDFFLSQLHPDDRDEIERGVKKCIAGAPCKPVEYRLRTKGGDYRWFRAIGRVTFDDRGAATRFTGILQDIQERKEMEKRLAQANRKLKFKTGEMEQMIYTVSHDLKSPLASLVGMAHLLRDQESAEAEPNQHKLELIGHMIQSGRHLADFIDEIMDLSFLGKASERVEPLDLNEMVEELRTVFASEIGDAQCKLLVEGELPRIRANRVTMRQILQNLLGNAIKYGCSGTDKRVVIGAESKGPSLEIYVQDFGPGIAKEHQDAIFGLFTRLDYEKPGSGVGLAIVEKAARLSGGSVRVESKPGKGARFTLTLPRSLVVAS